MTALPAPDPAQGLFETLLILAGEPVELDAHLDRLAASLRELFGAPLPRDLAQRAIEASRDIELGRMRIDVPPPAAPTAGKTIGQATLRTQPVDRADFFPVAPAGAALRSVLALDGLGRHKWADRRPLNEVPGQPVPLIFDRNGEVLEAGRANVFAAYGQVLVTPRADGRILPGTARAAAIEIAHAAGIEIRERRLTRSELFAADQVVLTGSVRGVEPAISLDGEELPATGELGELLGNVLRRRWSQSKPPAA